jgi:hypothetical protein
MTEIQVAEDNQAQESPARKEAISPEANKTREVESIQPYYPVASTLLAAIQLAQSRDNTRRAVNHVGALGAKPIQPVLSRNDIMTEFMENQGKQSPIGAPLNP